MNVRKFIAANARDALRKVKETLGDDAIILSNRGVPGGVEIMAVAARDMAMIVPTQVAQTPQRPAPERRPVIDEVDTGLDYRISLNAARIQASQGLARHAIPIKPIAAPIEKPIPPARTQVRSAGIVNAGIPKTGSLRNLEIGKNQSSTVAVSAGTQESLSRAAPREPATINRAV